MSTVSQIVPLHLLFPGEAGIVREIVGDAHLLQRLDEMGLRAGVAIRMVQPGHPCLVALGHQRLSFRGEDDAIVLVEVTRP